MWKEFRNSSELAFSLIFSKHYSDLNSYGCKITPNEELVKDTIQELMITLWNSRGRLGKVSSIKHYLLKSLRRSLIRNLEKQKKSLLHLRLYSEYQPDITFSPEETIILEESSRDTDAYLTTLLNSLPKRQKEAVYLKYYTELSFEEVADIMGVNYQSVVNHLHKAFKVLRKSKGLSSTYAPTGAMDM